MEGVSRRSWVYWLIGVITAFITSFYMFRLWFMTFFGDYRGTQVRCSRARTSPMDQPTATAIHTRAQWSCWCR